MLKISSNIAGYEYETIALVRSFFPGEEVRMVTPESSTRDRELLSEEPKIVLLMDVEKDGRIGATRLELAALSPTENLEKVCFEIRMDLDPADRSQRHDLKEKLKRFLYDSLSEYTGQTLPWGDLIGIRPTKIAMTMLEDGKREDEIEAFLKEVHAVSQEKCDVAIQIAKLEREILGKIHYEDGFSLYIGIPFCPTTCLYCSFTSYAIAAWRERVPEYLEALFQEIDYVAKESQGKILDTIYVGGGTPTSLDAQSLERLMIKITETLDLSHLQEFTVEAGRPDSITEEKLAVLKKYGVTRISVNPQTMNQETLDLIGRRHSVQQVKDTFAVARKLGFDNINMDIILGLPGEKEEQVDHTIREICELDPDSLTVHSLAVKRASKLGNWIKENGIETLNNTDFTMEIALQGAYRMEMLPYYLYRQKNISGNFENVGYAKAGKYGIYNILIMEEVQTIVACGAGTVTKRVYPDGRIERCDNVKEVALYIEKIEEMIERKRVLFSDVN